MQRRMMGAMSGMRGMVGRLETALSCCLVPG